MGTISSGFMGFFVEDDFSVVDIIPTTENLNEEQIREFDFGDIDEELDAEEERFWS